MLALIYSRLREKALHLFVTKMSRNSAGSFPQMIFCVAAPIQNGVNSNLLSNPLI